MQNAWIIDGYLLAAPKIFCSQGGYRRELCGVQVGTYGCHLVKLWMEGRQRTSLGNRSFHLCRWKNPISTFVLYTKRNILTWKRETEVVTCVVCLCPEPDGHFPQPVPKSNTSKTPLSFCKLYSSFKVKLKFWIPPVLSLPGPYTKQYYHGPHHLLFTIGALAVAFLSHDSFKNGTEPSLSKMA